MVRLYLKANRKIYFEPVLIQKVPELVAGKAGNSEPAWKWAANAMTSKQLTEAHRSLGFTSGRWAGSHVVGHKVRVNHLPVGSQGLCRDGILAALEEEAAKVHDSLLWNLRRNALPAYQRLHGRDASALASFPVLFAISCLMFIHATLFALVLLLFRVSWCGGN